MGQPVHSIKWLFYRRLYYRITTFVAHNCRVKTLVNNREFTTAVTNREVVLNLTPQSRLSVVFSKILEFFLTFSNFTRLLTSTHAMLRVDTFPSDQSLCTWRVLRRERRTHSKAYVFFHSSENARLNRILES